VLAQHFHNASIGAELIVDGNNLGHRAALGSLEDGVETIGIRFIGTEHAEVGQIHSEDVAEEVAQLARSLSQNLSGPRDFERVIGEVGQREGDQLASAIDVGLPPIRRFPAARELRVRR